jgi:hypothetical protein
MPFYLFSLMLLLLAPPKAVMTDLTPAEMHHVSAVVTLGNDSGRLSVSVTNKSPTAISLRANSLPWAHRNAMLLIIAEPSTQTQLEQDVAISDTATSLTVVPVHGHLTGAINLPERFPRFREMREKVDLVLFWAFRLEFADGSSDVKSGTILLPRRLKRALRRSLHGGVAP